MKKAKRNNNTNKAITTLKYDFTHKGFALDHAEKVIYVLEVTDIAIRNGNEELMNEAMALMEKYPTYSGAVLHVMFLA